MPNAIDRLATPVVGNKALLDAQAIIGQPALRNLNVLVALRVGLVFAVFWLEWCFPSFRSGIFARALPKAFLQRLAEFLIPVLGLMMVIASRTSRPELARLRDTMARGYVSTPFLAAHALTWIFYVVISRNVFRLVPATSLQLLIALLLCGLPSLLFLLLTFFRFGALQDMFLATKVAGLVGAIVLLCEPWLFGVASGIWNDSSRTLARLTFRLVRVLLQSLSQRIDFDTAQLRIGGPGFHVTIAGQCSGTEGLFLILTFSSAWLWFYRQEFRYPGALALIPAGLAAMWISNAVRISVLILIGLAGGKEIAIGGFHSLAGWIAFNTVAFGVCAAGARIPWFRKEHANVQAETEGHNIAAPYLTPFLVILAASLFSRAFSAGFEWLYPLRLATALAALWFYRREYAKLDWRFGWVSPFLGTAVFAGWVALARWSGSTSNPTLSSALAGLSPALRFGWIAARVAAAAITVPVAEELAFRAYGSRRLMSVDFDLVDLRKVSWTAVAGSSVVFGIMHGNLWPAGIAAGIAYALAMRLRGRIGDAVVAHATTNLLIAFQVLARGDWGLW